MKTISSLPHFWQYYSKKFKQNGIVGAGKEVVLRAEINLYGKSSLVRKIASMIAGKKVPHQWVFILGCYNSGTTLLQRLLASHNSICTLPREGVRFTNELSRPEDLGWTRMWTECLDYMNKDICKVNSAAQRIIRDWSPWWRGSGNVFLEKSITNILRAEWLEQHFPNAYFIGITRNGYGASEGIARRARPKGQAQKGIGKQYPIEMAANEWVVANQLLLEYANHLQRYFSIRYEDLIASPKFTLNQIFDFLDLENCDISETGRGVNINSLKYELWDGNEHSMNRLTNEQIDKITPIIASLQHEFGYSVFTAKRKNK